MIKIGNGVKRVLLGLAKSISLDAWNRQKVIFDRSLFKSKFTYNIPDKDWILPATVSGSGSVTSSNGGLLVSTGTTLNSTTYLRSRRHPSYQADKGLLFSIALIIPNPDATGERSWGIYFRNTVTPYQTGILFELIDGVLTFSQITTYDGLITGKSKSVEIDYTRFLTPNGTLRALFDIQGQWRGVGDYFAYLNLEKVATLRNLTQDDSDDKVTIINPSLPTTIEAKNTDGVTDLKIIAGCINFATEGGGKPNYRTQAIRSLQPGAVALTEVPVLIMYIPGDYLGQHNSRDTILRRVTMSSPANLCYANIYSTRDKTAFGAVAFGDIDGEVDFVDANASQSCIKYYNNFTSTSKFDPDKANFIDGDTAEPSSPLRRHYTEDDEDIVAVGGDYIVFTMQKQQGAGDTIIYCVSANDEEI